MLDNIIPESQEVWLPVVGFEGLYEVSDLGQVRRASIGSEYGIHDLLKPSMHPRGYHSLWLHGNGKKKQKLVHRLVAIAFIPNPENKPQVNHIDGDKTNNKVKNLEWVTSMENQRHSIEVLGNSIVGSRHGNSKLTEQDVIEIRSSKKKNSVLASRYGVNKVTIRDIKCRKSWKHINP